MTRPRGKFALPEDAFKAHFLARNIPEPSTGCHLWTGPLAAKNVQKGDRPYKRVGTATATSSAIADFSKPEDWG